MRKTHDITMQPKLFIINIQRVTNRKIEQCKITLEKKQKLM